MNIGLKGRERNQSQGNTRDWPWYILSNIKCRRIIVMGLERKEYSPLQYSSLENPMDRRA